MIFDALGFMALGQIPFQLTTVIHGGGRGFARRPMIDDFVLEDDEALLIWMMCLQ